MAARSKFGYGWKPSLPDHRDFKLVHSLNAISRPNIFNLEDKMPSIWNQGDTNSCVGHGVSAALSYQFMQNNPKDTWTPSRLFVYFNSRMIEHCQDSDSGTSIRDALKGVSSYGVPHETDWPFIEKEVNTKPTWHTYNLAKPHKITNYLSVVQPYDNKDRRIESINTTIANGEPVIFGATLYESFEGDQIAKTGIVTMPANSESVVGGHCMLIVGYNDVEKMYTVRNSWGADWGLKGYCKFPYAYISNAYLASDFWVIRSVS